MGEKRVTIAICQVPSDLATEECDPRDANLTRALTRLREAAARGAQLVLFGEVYLNGYRSDRLLARYSCQVEPPDRWLEALANACRELGVYVAMGVSRAGRAGSGALFNSAILVGPAGIMGHYDKLHLGTYELPDGRLVAEGAYWDEGDATRVFDLPWGRVGIQICRDLRYPEVSRAAAVAGAEVIVNLSAAMEERADSWDVLSRARAMENQAWFVMASVVGHQKDSRLAGGSRVVDPEGRVVLRLGNYTEEIGYWELDLEAVHELRRSSHVLTRRVPDAYSVT